MTEVAASPEEERIDDDVLLAVFDGRLAQAKQYHDILAGRAVEWGLIGPRESERLWSRHILNCAAIQALIASGSTVIDVGSGAGLPGIPLALARADLKVTLLDSLLRRVKFLQLAVEELALQRQVDVIRERAEQLEGRYDVVVARAVAPLERLVRWCAPLTKGSILALKGDQAERELEEARPVLRRIGMSGIIERVSTVPGCPDAMVVVISKL